jgi:hypothetical protein
MEFLIIMPERLIAPNNARKPKGTSKASSPALMPIAANGTVQAITSAGLKALNKATMMNAMTIKVGMAPGTSDAWAVAVSSNSPPHSEAYPGGSSMASSSSRTLARSDGKVTPGIGLA